MNEKDVLYGRILAKLFQNIESEDYYNSGIYIDGYEDNAIGRVYMTLVDVYADMYNKKVNLCLPFLKYLLFILKHWKGRKRYKYCGIDLDYVTPINKIAKFVANYYEQPISIYEDIYKEYYS